MVLVQRSRPRRKSAVRTVRVRVKGGYEPSVVHGRAGEALRIVFSREETAACSEHVVFPSLGKSAMLPPFEDVSIDFVPERAGEYEFTCQMGVLRGRLVIDGRPGAWLAEAAPDLIQSARPRQAGGAKRDQGDSALLVFVPWLCILPVLLLVAVPTLGWRAGGLLALASFGVAAAVCVTVCVRRVQPGDVRPIP